MMMICLVLSTCCIESTNATYIYIHRMVVLTLLIGVGDQLVRAQLHHDRRQNEERASALLANRNPGPKVDYLVPIIADGDTGHGGLSAVMKLVKLFVEVRVYVFGVVHDTHYSLPNAIKRTVPSGWSRRSAL